MRKIELIKDYYEDGINIFSKKIVTIIPGVTVLIGCNGYGKSTLFDFIKDSLYKDKIKFIHYNDRQEGGINKISSAIFDGNIAFASASYCSSEGERIILNLGQLAQKIRSYVKGSKQDEYWILLDAVDSGLSIDNVIDLKNLFKAIIEDNKESKVYIIVSANEYELVNGENCLDVYNCKYRQFKTYNAYRNFILKTREIKDRRYK